MKNNFFALLFISLLSSLTLGLTGCSLSSNTTSFAVDLERKISGLDKKSYTLNTGENIVYLEAGNPQHQTIVFLHGFGANKDNFTRIARKFTSQYHIIIPDLVGFGESSRIENGQYDTATQASRLQQLLQQLNIQHAHFAGNSMGGHIALAYAAKYPTQVDSLLLLDPGGFWSVPRTPIFNSKQDANPLIVESEEDYIHLFDLAMSKPPFVPKFMLKEMAKPSIANATLERKISAQLNNDAIEQRAATVKQPTLVIWGDEDQLLDVATTKTIQSIMPQAQIIIMNGIGHMPMLEAPKQTAQAYLQFLDTLHAK